MTVKETRRAYQKKLREQQEAARKDVISSAGYPMGVIRPGNNAHSSLKPARRPKRIKMSGPNWRTKGPVGEVTSWFVDPDDIKNGSAGIPTPTNEAEDTGGVTT